MIIDQEFRLRAVERSDLSWLKHLREDPSVSSCLGTFCLLNDERQERWFNSLQTDSTKCYMIFEKRESNNSFVKLGMVRITEIDLINRSMCVGGDLAQEYRGKGYAKDMYKLIFQYGFNHMNMHRLYLFVLEDNMVAKGLYQQMGFKLEGVQREAIYSNGKYKNYEMMGLLKNEYLEHRG
ncbi:MAG: GNAT family N-acetyltransferase [Bacteriovoracaceae bacterium]|nr:GNAT family N-acetyltransferase [Bacteriovoracaceae bacterium]